jgi:hypothetical protein
MCTQAVDAVPRLQRDTERDPTLIGKLASGCLRVQARTELFPVKASIDNPRALYQYIRSEMTTIEMLMQSTILN